MKITDVKLTAFTRPAAGKPSDYAIKNTGDSLIDLLTKYVAIQIVTDEGVTGESFSLGGGVGMAHYLASTVKPFLIGKNPMHREAIWQGMWHFNRFWLTPVTTLGVVDVVSGYDQAQALHVGRALEELGFLWYEEPLREYDIHGYKMLADKLDIPIAGVEVNEGSIYTTPEYIVTRAVDIVRSCVGFKGGIGQVKKTAALAEAFGMKCEIHTNGNPVLDAANLAVAASIKNTSFFEQLVPEPLFNFGVEEFIHIDAQGFAHLPKGPGLGMKIDWDFVKRYAVAEL